MRLQVDLDAIFGRCVDEEVLLSSDVNQSADDPIKKLGLSSRVLAPSNIIRVLQEAQQQTEPATIAMDVKSIIGEPPAKNILGKLTIGRELEELGLCSLLVALPIGGEELLGQRVG